MPGASSSPPICGVVYFDQAREHLDTSQTLGQGTRRAWRFRGLSATARSTWRAGRSASSSAPTSSTGRSRASRAASRRGSLIARLMLQPADLLLMDEPTNDLDIPTLEVLEESLQRLPGRAGAGNSRSLPARPGLHGGARARWAGRRADLCRLLAMGGDPVIASRAQSEGAARPRPDARGVVEEEIVLPGGTRVGTDGGAHHDRGAGARGHPRGNAGSRRGLRWRSGCTTVTSACRRRSGPSSSSMRDGRNWKANNNSGVAKVARHMRLR